MKQFNTFRGQLNVEPEAAIQCAKSPRGAQQQYQSIVIHSHQPQKENSLFSLQQYTIDWEVLLKRKPEPVPLASGPLDLFKPPLPCTTLENVSYKQQ